MQTASEAPLMDATQPVAALFQPFTLRSITMRNRIGVSPMCQYSAVDGLANDWHLVHLGRLAAGGAGLVMVEATAVEARGRITPADLGIWNDEHIDPLRRIASFIEGQGAVAAIQLAHAGRKASTRVPWEGGDPLTREEGSWTVIAPSPIPFSAKYPIPTEVSREQIAGLVDAFRSAAGRSLKAGFRVIELHAAHGYLLHSFLSPLSNQRTDEYGGSFENRIRLVTEVVSAMREVWPEELPLWVRVSASDWVEGGWTADDTVRLAGMLKELGVDVLDCSSGGLVPHARISTGPGYQVPFADRVRAEAGMKTAAVGLITSAQQANVYVDSGSADIVLLARELLRNPAWPIEAAKALGASVRIPPQYLRAY